MRQSAFVMAGLLKRDCWERVVNYHQEGGLCSQAAGWNPGTGTPRQAQMVLREARRHRRAGQLGYQCGSNLEVLGAPVKLREARLHVKQPLLHLRRPRSNKEKTGKLTGPPWDAKGAISGPPLGKPHASLPLHPRGYLRVRRMRKTILIHETPDPTQRDCLSY